MASLQRRVKRFDTALTAYQRVEGRMDLKKKPAGNELLLDQAKSLRKIAGLMEGMLDVMRFTVSAYP